MSRIKLVNLWLFLLCLFPALAQSQSLTSYEYWFDDDFRGRQSGSLRGSDAVVNVGLDTDQLDNGFHKFSFRARQNDGRYSAISTSLFLKRSAERGSKIEYWFDDNFDQRESMEIGNTDSEQALVLDLRDNSRYPMGFHKLNMRVIVEGKGGSMVYSTGVLKLSAGKATQLEYWIDDDRDNLRTINGKPDNDSQEYVFMNDLELGSVSPGVHRISCRPVSSSKRTTGAVTTTLFFKRPEQSGDKIEYWFDDNYNERDNVDIENTESEQTLVLDLRDNSKYPIGFHKLNMRVILEGEGESMVYSTGVLKLSAGKATQLEYWIDNDRSNVRTIGGRPDDNGREYVFISDLDLDGITSGHHRIYCRPVSSSRVTAGAITSLPIVVKSLYNQPGDNVKMTSFSIAVDNEEPVTIKVSDSKNELKLNPYTINVRDLPSGDHTLKARFWNSVNTSVSFEQGFKANPIETPVIHLTAVEKDGHVTFRFNSVPNDVRWGLIRTDANGVKARVDWRTQGSYPFEVTSVDNPPAGNYTYVVKCVYTDASGTEQPVSSNEVTVSISPSQNDLYGNISGRVLVNGRGMTGERWNIIFSDSVTIKTDFYGSYYRDKIPVGTVLEITAQSYDYKCDTTSVTVKEGANYADINGIFDEEAVRARYSNDLQFDSNVEFMPRRYMKFKVKNINRLPWHGKLRIVTARKDFVDNPPKNPFDLNDTQQLAGSVAPFVVNDYYQYDYSDVVWLSPGESADVVIAHNVPLTSPPTGKDEPYYFYVESVDDYGTKLVAVNSDYNIKENPLVQLIDNGEYSSTEEDIETCVNVIMALCGTVTELDGRLGDLSRCMSEMEETLGDALCYDDLAGVIERSGSYVYIRDEIPSWKLMNIVYHEDRRFLGMVNTVRDKIAEEVRLCKDALAYTKMVKECLDEVKRYNQWRNMTDLERAGEIASKILDLSEKEFPFVKILKTYLDVTENTVHNILALAERWDEIYNYATFYNGAELYYSNDFSFDIRVRKKGLISTFFDADAVKNQILSAEIKCIGKVGGNAPLECTATYTPVVNDGKVRLKRVGIKGMNPEMGGVVPIVDMWMTIWWSNGRVTYVPIRSSAEMKGNGVTHERNHYTITFQSKTRKDEYMADIINLDD